MNETPPNPSDREQRLQVVLAGSMQAVEAGQTPDRAELLARHPDLADELASFFANREEFAQLAGLGANHAPPASEAATVGANGPTDAVPVVGEKLRYFGDYEILDEIARGGMGVVFKARQVSLNRVVALKMILAGQLATPLDVQHFKHEAEAAANLDHPNIVPIYELNEHAGSHLWVGKPRRREADRRVRRGRVSRRPEPRPPAPRSFLCLLKMPSWQGSSPVDCSCLGGRSAPIMRPSAPAAGSLHAEHSSTSTYSTARKPQPKEGVANDVLAMDHGVFAAGLVPSEKTPWLPFQPIIPSYASTKTGSSACCRVSTAGPFAAICR